MKKSHNRLNRTGKTRRKAKMGQRGKHSIASSLVSRHKIDAFPVVLGSDSAKESFTQHLGHFTRSDAAVPVDVNTTPQNRHLVLGPHNQCGRTPGGSVLIYSPSQHLSVEVITPAGKNRESISLFLLRREHERQPKAISSIYQVLQSNPKTTRASLAAIATKKSQSGQPKRKTQRSEKNAVRKSAKELVIDYFQMQGVNTSNIENETWNLCHLLSYAIAKNAATNDGGVFDPQVIENIFSGSRSLNENMMRIENVLLKMLNENEVKEIQYMAIHSEFKNSHILAELTLEVEMLTHNNRKITFSYEFDVTDSRKHPQENSTAYYALLKSIIDTSAKKEQSVTVSPQAFFQAAPEIDTADRVSRNLFHP